MIILPLAAGLLSLHRAWNSKLPELVLLPPTTTITHNPLPERWIPGSWGWMWWLRDALLGKRTPVNCDAEVFQLTELPAVGALDLGKPALATNGLQMWSL
ncbi:MAG TPA: hypothetical protein VK850_04245, partial [Candidatus Binatia bacterium]|nr:hypothetical protein [Candidatus Binatia bacterium]